MRTSTLIVAAIATSFNATLDAIFVSRHAMCTSQPNIWCSGKPMSQNFKWANEGFEAQVTRHGGECVDYDWTLAPRVCAGNLVQDQGAELPEYRAHRQGISWCIQHQEYQLEFTSWGYPEVVELFASCGGAGLYCSDSDGVGHTWQWSEDFQLTRIGEEDGGPTKMAIRRGRMEAMGEADRRASRPGPDNSWKRHRKSQWR